ncbi:NAD-dependent epimerase/dehydratase family protein [Tamlana haliotis]|uniref:NAD-dependent epimerase/dehydratase family protein n=1 Tax=Pseudotamlana haliotis TaxID=2614804 RepID=A0A6N6MJF7_9FLAO|nr:SDR family NAD(P)-dependent oxidoreductase [Tamlana haliotis]KAB1071290.1 NAD-dependent epimerase/dehydratase family protein [Tamlana haliotis]
MEISTSKIIDELLSDSGLFSFIKKDKIKEEIFNFSEETILVTGAAGTIGSELTKKLVKGTFKKLILIDFAESPLYNLIKDLEFENTNNLVYQLLDITDELALKNTFNTYKPTIVFHTAAYKHVPLMEQNPYKAVNNNIFGTQILADLSSEFLVDRFIFISTDKAVNPISVMGMSKRISEVYLNYLNTISKTTFINTRFGNIIGSNGSVLPLLKKQIESELPITLTSKHISRYFISKHKACELILKIAQIENTENNTFTFNMGKPIKISDIVERLLYNYSKTIDSTPIKITELRLGEKLHEDILSNSEYLIPTKLHDVFMVKTKTDHRVKPIDFKSLKTITANDSLEEIKSILLECL